VQLINLLTDWLTDVTYGLIPSCLMVMLSNLYVLCALYFATVTTLSSSGKLRIANTIDSIISSSSISIRSASKNDET